MNPLASQPRISVIIPSRPDEDIQPTLARLRASAYPADLVEIWHATGSQPSIQRNRCAARAGGDLLYFLDNDSQIISAPNQSDTVTQLVAQCVQQPHAIVGGPSLTPASDMWFQQAVGVIFSSRFGGGAVRARYAPIGRTRSAGQHEIILCNMMMERAAFQQLGGFNEQLYPNEENDLMCRHLARGWPIIYVPTAGIYRSQRRTIRAFCRQLFTYGRGRAEQTRINPRSFSPMAIAASGFVFYWLLLWPLAWWLGPVVALLPATAYAGLNLLFSLAGSLRARRWLLLPVLPVLFFINHFLYGAGFLYGLLRPRRQPSAPASADAGWTLEKIKAFGG